MIRPIKRIKLNDQTSIVPDTDDLEVDDQNEVFCRANDIIRLKFLHDFDTKHEILPTFTHQLFENERINFISNPSNVKVEVIIQCRDLVHSVHVVGCNSYEKELLIQGLKLAIPNDSEYYYSEIYSTEMINVSQYLENTSVPSGKFLHQFSNKNNEMFEIYLANNKDNGTTELLRRCEKLAMWFIETADSVDFEDDRWEILLCFQVMNNDRTNKKMYNIAGYMTLFTFNNPFIGAKIRVCQALVLPYHQGKNIGKFILKEVYKLAKNRNTVVEVTVEDPAPGFQRLRDCVDCEWFIDSTNINNTSDPQLFETEDLAKKLKITNFQAQFISDAFSYASFVTPGTIFEAKKIIENQGNTFTS